MRRGLASCTRNSRYGPARYSPDSSSRRKEISSLSTFIRNTATSGRFLLPSDARRAASCRLANRTTVSTWRQAANRAPAESRRRPRLAAPQEQQKPHAIQHPVYLAQDPELVPGVGGIHQPQEQIQDALHQADRKSTRLNSSHRCISYAVF